MRGSSATSLKEALRNAEDAFAQQLQALDDIAQQLFAATDVIDSSNRLVRLLADDGTPAQVRETTVRTLFGDRLHHAAIEIVVDMVRRRWSAQQDLLDAIEIAGVSALLKEAETASPRTDVVQDLFQIRLLIDDSPELSRALADRRHTPQLRAHMLTTVLGERVDPYAKRIAERAVAASGEASAVSRLETFTSVATARHRQHVAYVVSAQPLADDQRSRLAGILSAQYGHDVTIVNHIDEKVVGGIRVEIGDDLYDATVAARLERAREAMAS